MCDRGGGKSIVRTKTESKKRGREDKTQSTGQTRPKGCLVGGDELGDYAGNDVDGSEDGSTMGLGNMRKNLLCEFLYRKVRSEFAIKNDNDLRRGAK
jgi:hypothetical protein